MTLWRVSAAARSSDRAAARLRAAVVEAVEAGQPVAAVAEAAGVTRQTVYRWLSAPR